MGSKSRIATRNSNLEALRLVGMALVVFNHFIQRGQEWPDFPYNIPFILLRSAGGVGDVLFFGITAYFCANRNTEPSLKSSLKKVWILERQLLWCSVVFFLLTVTAWSYGLAFNSVDEVYIKSLAVKSLLPLSRKLWWYPSAYAIFLLLQPYLNQLLRRVGANAHGCLAGVLFLLASVAPGGAGLTFGWSPLLFVYLYVLVTYLTWYVTPSSALLRTTMVLGIAGGVLAAGVSGLLGDSTANDLLNTPQAALPVMIGLSALFLAVSEPPRCLPILNAIAANVFGVYLLLCYPPFDAYATTKVIRYLESLANGNWLLCLLLEIAGAIAILLVGILLDWIRSRIFLVLFDKNKGALFERLWAWAKRRYPELQAAE